MGSTDNKTETTRRSKSAYESRDYLEHMADRGCAMAMYRLAKHIRCEDDEGFGMEMWWYDRFLHSKAVGRVFDEYYKNRVNNEALDHIIEAAASVGIYYSRSSDYDDMLMAWRCLAIVCSLMEDSNDMKKYFAKMLDDVYERIHKDYYG